MYRIALYSNFYAIFAPKLGIETSIFGYHSKHLNEDNFQFSIVDTDVGTAEVNNPGSPLPLLKKKASIRKKVRTLRNKRVIMEKKKLSNANRTYIKISDKFSSWFISNNESKTDSRCKKKKKRQGFLFCHTWRYFTKGRNTLSNCTI